MKGTSRPMLFEQVQGGGSAEARQVEVGQYHVPFASGWLRRDASRRRFRRGDDGPVAGALEVARQKSGILLVVLYQEHAQWRGVWLAFDLLWLFRGTHRCLRGRAVNFDGGQWPLSGLAMIAESIVMP